MRIEGEWLYYGPSKLDLVGFFRSIQSFKEIDKNTVEVVTEAGIYRLCEYRNKSLSRVETISGTPLSVFGREILDKEG